METGAYGERLGAYVGVEAPPTVKGQPVQNAEFAATRVFWGDREEGVAARIEREDAFLVCLERRDVASHPYWVDGRPVTMSYVGRGQFSLLDLNLEHSSYMVDPLDCVAMYVPRAALNRLADENAANRVETISIAPGAAVDDPVVWHLGECLLPALERPKEANRLFVDHIAMALFVHLACSYGGMTPLPAIRRGGLAPWQERRAKEILMARIDGNVSLDELARQCNLSRSHFARAFKASTGVPPHRWLLARRVERAREMLLNTDFSIQQIAVSCGFADLSHFTRVFTKFLRVGPGEWRRMRRI